MPGCVHKASKRKMITINLTSLLEGLNHRAVEDLLDGLTARELTTLAKKVHGAVYRRMDRAEYNERLEQDLFDWGA